ncbi:MAG: diguanylate cyclase [Lachnospiraceae bacterium]|nr:diguanylate cyclase [Lachnospiraceae bacterium]
MKHILVVDDSATNLSFVENILKEKYKLALAKSGERALKYLEKTPVDLILLDIMMQGLDGFETYERIKGLSINSNTPVVFLTADVNVENEIKGLNMGAMDFIRKPFVPEVMLNRIDHILQLEELRKDLEKKVEEKTKQIEQISFETIVTIASMIEAKDSYTKGHSVRVSEYSARLAKKLGWEEERIQNLKYVALLHDIGKVGIPDSVLNKPGKLTEIEYEIIKSHTTIGGNILSEIETIPGVALGAKYHHERYDGKGYPTGIAGEEIPEIARIICICDAYDAMNSKRVYRDKLSIQAICEQFEAGRGTQFDACYVDAFLKLIKNEELSIEDDVYRKNNKKTLSGESTLLLNQIVKNIEEENQKNEKYDFLTGLLNRKNGEKAIAEALRETSGCLAFIDLDNLKKTNDIMGHLAGDYAIKSVGDVLLSFHENAIISRIGGDEFLYYILETDENKAKEKIQEIIQAFDNRKQENTYLSFSSLSIGMYMTQKGEFYSDALKKADKALYHIKQSGKSGYYMHTHTENACNKKASVDLDRIVKSLKESGKYQGTKNLEYREFTKIYDFVQKLVGRFGYNVHFLMLTLEPADYNEIDLEEQEYAMECMEKTIQNTLRNIDVSTRFSSEQFLVVLLNAEKKDVEVISNRIFDRFYKIYNRNAVNLSYDIADLTENSNGEF